MSRWSYLFLLTALSVGPEVLSAQTTDQTAASDKDAPAKDERKSNSDKTAEGRPPGDWKGRGNRDGRDAREGRGSRRNPMDDFRRLLSLSPEDRAKDLADKPDHFRDMLLSKLKEYDAMPEEQRELRLRSTELRFDMMYLLRASTEKRQEKLTAMPEDRRKLLEERLKQWDNLSPELQQEVQEHQSTLHYVIRVEAAPAAAKEDVFKDLPPEVRDRVKKRVDEFNSQPKEKVMAMVDTFHKLFELSDKEQQSILEKLSNDERARLEKKIAEFEKLPPSERKKCMDSARNFNKLSPEEQTRFLSTAQRWEKMSEDERNTWRNLVKQMPPLPPGLTPPLPSGAAPDKGETTPPAPALPVAPKN